MRRGWGRGAPEIRNGIIRLKAEYGPVISVSQRIHGIADGHLEKESKPHDSAFELRRRGRAGTAGSVLFLERTKNERNESSNLR